MILFLVKILDRISLVLSTFYCTFIFKRVGKNSYIYRPLRVIGGKYVTIGKNVTIQKSLRIEAIDTWHYVLDYHKDKLEQKFTPKITISDNVGIEQNVHITAATDLEIGDGSQIMPNVCITNIDHDYKNVKISPKGRSTQ